jgi:MoxR-like ATPase
MITHRMSMSNHPTDLSPTELYETLHSEITRVLVGNDVVVERLLYALLTGGHLLLEGVPGIAKTVTAESFARASGLSFNRIQMTPDVLPADVTGTTIYRDETGEFEVQYGPVFSNIVVADEINRATPKTQSALLEAMGERQVTIETETHALPEQFLVIATQNPLEMEGVYELPEAQRDRFQFKLRLDYPGPDAERTILDRFDAEPDLGPSAISQVVTPEVIAAARQTVRETYVAPAVKDYLLEIVIGTRNSDQTEIGASPRAALDLLHAAKARAAVAERDYVVPDDVKALAVDVLAHRLVLSTDAELGDVTTVNAVESVLEIVEPPSNDVNLSMSGGSTDGPS